MSKPENPTLFSFNTGHADPDYYGTNITLRDLFGAMAMHAILTSADMPLDTTPEEAMPRVASAAYGQADAMLKAREEDG